MVHVIIPMASVPVYQGLEAKVALSVSVTWTAPMLMACLKANVMRQRVCVYAIRDVLVLPVRRGLALLSPNLSARVMDYATARMENAYASSRMAGVTAVQRLAQTDVPTMASVTQ